MSSLASRTDALRPTREEIGDPVAAAARVRAFRQQMYAQTKPKLEPAPKPVEKVIILEKRTPAPEVAKPNPVIAFDKMVMAEIERRVVELIADQQLILRAKLEKEVRLEMTGRIKELRDEMAEKLEKQIKMADICKVVCRKFQVSSTDLYSSRRTAAVVWPRQVAMYYCKTYTLHSLPEIGRFFNGRDHTTVLHAVRKVDAAVKSGAFVALTKYELIRTIQDYEIPPALCAEYAG